MKVYIISWFGLRNKKEKREYRKQIHKEQVEWLLEKGHEPIVFYQDYDDDEFLPNVEYLDGGYNNKQMAQPFGRNVLMEHFYKTDDDYAVFADNDAIWRDDLFDYDIVERIDNRSKDLVRKVDFIVSLNPQWHPFNKSIKDEKERYDNYFVFEKTGWQMKESIYIMANFKKHYGKSIWYDPTNFVDENNKFIQVGEGIEFMLDVYSSKIGNQPKTVLMCRQWVLKELCTNYATWMEDNQDKVRYRIAPELLQQWLDKYEIPYQDMNKVEYLWIGYRDTGKKIEYRKYPKSSSIGKVDVVEQLPRPMNNKEISDYLDSDESKHLDSTLREFDREDLNRPFRVKKDFSKFYKHINFVMLDKITLEEKKNKYNFF
tara:strand:+ start:230 stop:1345 length:1116 start_codon:yes stop_codon:yes gene_type:complete